MFRFVYFIFLIALLSSCSSIYMPNVPNASMLSKKGELYASGHLSLKGNISVNSAYAVNNHLGIMLNASTISRQQKSKDFRQNLVEIGAGYFNTFGPNNSRILEIYAGVGNGSTQRNFKEFDDNNLVAQDNQVVNFNKTFLQVNYSSKKQKSLKLFSKSYPLNYGTIVRISHLTMENFTRNGILQPKEDNIFIEPVFFTRLKLNSVLQLQYTSGSNFGLKSRKFLTAGNSIFTVGIALNLGYFK